MKLSITKILRSQNWIAVNKDLVKAVGCNAVYLLGYLCEQYEYRNNRGEVTSDGYFYAIASDVTDEIGLTTHEQDTAVKRLISAGILTSKLKGMPAKKHYKISEENQSAIYSIIMGDGIKVAEKTQDLQAETEEPPKITALRKARNKLCGKRETSFAESAKQALRNEPSKFHENREALYIDLNTKSNSVENKFSTDNNKEEAREIFEEKINAENAEIFASFDEKCKAKGLLEILKIKKRFSEKKLAEKIFEFGEADFWAMVEQIDTHLANNKKAKYSDLPAVLVKWFGTADENAAKNALNNFWRAKFGFEYESITNWSKAQKTAIKSIGVKIRESVAAKSKINVADVSTKQLREAIEKFFGALPPKWSDVKWFKLETIASSFSAIMAAISEEHKAKKATAVIQEQATADKPKSFGEKCAEILVGATPEDASQIAHRIAPKLKLRGDEIILKALAGMVAWAARTSTVITNDDSIGQTVEDYCNFIINKRKEAK